MIVRELKEIELSDIWTIDRRNEIEKIYDLRAGKLILKSEYWDITGWPSDAANCFDPVFQDCYTRDGFFWDAFDDKNLVGIAVLESKFIGAKRNKLQLRYLYVS
jgi:hypothetical protein